MSPEFEDIRSSSELLFVLYTSARLLRTLSPTQPSELWKPRPGRGTMQLTTTRTRPGFKLWLPPGHALRLATGQQNVTASYLTAPFHGPFGEAARDTESLEWPNQQSAFLDRSPFPTTEVKCNGATSCMVTVVTWSCRVSLRLDVCQALHSAVDPPGCEGFFIKIHCCCRCLLAGVISAWRLSCPMPSPKRNHASSSNRSQ